MAAVRLFFFFLLLLLLSLLPLSHPQTDNQALLNLKKSFSDPQTLSSWVPDQNPCAARWVGVICSNNVINSLHLTDLSLSGIIDIEALTQIPSLRSISLVNNSFAGPIPPFSKLGVLKAIYLTNNKFSGPIPSDFFSHLASLKKIWLDNNKFSGPVPESLTTLRYLSELHLENNEFSGPIPELKQDIKSLDFSNNKLQGPIPPSMSRFEAKSFSGNVELCGQPLDKPCESAASEGSGWGLKVVVLIFIAAVLAGVFVMARSKRQRDDDFSVMSRDNAEEVVQVHVPSSNHSKGTSEGSRKESTSSKKGVGRSIGDLVMVNDERGTFGLPDLMKAAAEVLGNGGLGSAYKASMASGLSVVVKRMREMNKVSRDIFDAEMRRFGRLRNPNILTPLAYHYRKEEKLYVTEYMPKGSLLYVLHGDRGSSHSDLNWPIRLKIVKGIARGLGFLYKEFSTEELPHGNLKSSNVLLTQNYEALLSDFAFHPLINHNYAVQTLFAYKTPDYVTHQRVTQKTDVYCLGIIVLEVITGKFPSQYHSNGKGGTDVVHWVLTAISDRREAECIDPELKSTHSNSLNQMLQLLQIGAACTESNPDQRLNMKEAIRRIEEVQV
ncbi:pollen receptor-like kinase 3 [Vigna unguiculata]|uniref:Protein brassinosteroid insensitive 1 n=1 Tax=Vigna unguiculata TaxID=3917 RepID=A0A4D6L049_VIGUN|nr:pollen receptor-like kinase 3 [Vigna unguiculata]QCD80214.1 protein brassinosteroid insensitive 1 [Vigna unguiculata]